MAQVVSMSHAVYSVDAQPPLGGRRMYVGSLFIEEWGEDAESAVRARVEKCHMVRPSPRQSATWLRLCVDAQYRVVKVVDGHKAAALWELWETLEQFMQHGMRRGRVRGGPFCEIPVPWPEVDDLIAMARERGGTFEGFVDGLATMELSRDVKLHIEGACFNCGGVGHIASRCPNKALPLTKRYTEEEVSRKFAPHFIAVDWAVYFEKEGVKPMRWRYQLAPDSEDKRKKGTFRLKSVNIERAGRLFAVIHDGETLAKVRDEVEAIHLAAAFAVEFCNVPRRMLKRPAAQHTCPRKLPKLS